MSRSIFLIDEVGSLTELREQAYDSEALVERLAGEYRAS
jgi:hypothetical protein